MCEIKGPSNAVKLIAPCGKTVALEFPDFINPKDDEEVAVALGTLMRQLGYGRRDWKLEISTTTGGGAGVFFSSRTINSR